jgi:hypothetical protein
MTQEKYIIESIGKIDVLRIIKKGSLLFNVTYSLNIWEEGYLNDVLNNTTNSWFLINPKVFTEE